MSQALAVIEPQKAVRIEPQPGPQVAFLSSAADIAIYGGAAGGGKSFALLLEPLRHYNNPDFSAVIFRRTSTQVRNPGGLWDESRKLYMALGGWPRNAALDWRFPGGLRVKFAHLEHEDNIYDWQGAQLAMVAFDELVHFTEKQFWYLQSRCRSMSGVAGYTRATCNPDADSWVRKFIDWWIGPDGYPIPERSGVLRWFIRVEESLVWGDSREELVQRYGPDTLPSSLTFIPSKLDDNKILVAKDPTYRAKLRSMSRVDRLRLEGGNWNVRASAGNIFRKDWFKVVDAIPSNHIAAIRFWDRAATTPSETNRDPDWTRGVLLLRYADGTWLIADLRSMRATPRQVDELIRNTAAFDGPTVQVMAQRDPGSAGVAEADAFMRMLAGYFVKCEPFSGDKVTRAKPASAQCEAGNVLILRAPWNEEFLSELENFPESSHDDAVDAFSGALNELAATGFSILNVL